jgi:hypothetical protein
MKHTALVFALISLSGCLDDQRQALAQCEIEASRIVFHRQKISESGKAREGFVAACMRGKGYAFEPRQSRCTQDDERALNERCYAPTGSIPRMIYELEATLRDG